MRFLIFQSFLLICVASFSHGLQCKGQNNEPVDWYVIYKLPKKTTHSNEFIQKGLGFMYMTSNNYSKWILSEVSINDTSSMVANTLDGLYSEKNATESLHVLYNDQPPSGKTTSKGHTKGVVMAGEDQGFWLIHSVPHFPNEMGKYAYPNSGTHNGQSFLCITLNLKELNNVGVQLQYNEPYVYAQNIPETLSITLPDLVKAASNKTIKTAPWNNVQNITSWKGTKFLSFAKTRKFGKDLYADWVNSELGSDLLVQTWPNERNRLPSECDKEYQVDNILSISVSDPSISFNATVDHSKWAVSLSEDATKWICIGDVNRAQKQTLRGGGTTCLKNGRLAKQYRKIVSSVQPCDNNYFNEVFPVLL